MEQENLIRFRGKNVKITLKSTWKYRGLLLFVGEKDSLVDEVKDGKTWLTNDSIASICELENGKN